MRRQQAVEWLLVHTWLLSARHQVELHAGLIMQEAPAAQHPIALRMSLGNATL
jgi:hypothetical protein